jgi:hypothetical protein
MASAAVYRKEDRSFLEYILFATEVVSGNSIAKGTEERECHHQSFRSIHTSALTILSQYRGR